jgi:phage terminase small subunit
MAKERKEQPLDDRQMAFCREYIVDFNATKSAIRAGYSPKSARTTSSRLLAKDNISAEIQRLIQERNKRTEVTADRVIAEFAKIAFADIKDVAEWRKNYVYLRDYNEVDGTLIAEVKNTEAGIGVKLHDKMKALEALAKHTGVYDERPQVTVDVNSFIDALKGVANDGSVWDGFNNDTPDGDKNGKD